MNQHRDLAPGLLQDPCCRAKVIDMAVREDYPVHLVETMPCLSKSIGKRRLRFFRPEAGIKKQKAVIFLDKIGVDRAPGLAERDRQRYAEDPQRPQFVLFQHSPS